MITAVMPTYARKDVVAAAGTAEVEGCVGGDKSPEPLQTACDLPAGLVGVGGGAGADVPVDLAVVRPAALGGTEHDLGRAATRQGDAKGRLKEARDFAVGEAGLFVELDGQAAWDETGARLWKRAPSGAFGCVAVLRPGLLSFSVRHEGAQPPCAGARFPLLAQRVKE